MGMLGYLIPDIWYNCSHKLPGEERGLETQLTCKFSISFEMKKVIAEMTVLLITQGKQQ